MIRKATDADIPAIKAIWQEAFDDPLNYVDFLYNEVAKTSDTLLYETGRRVVAMVVLLPTEFVYRDKSVRAVYIYGAATLRRFRGRGIMTALLQHAEDTARAQGYALSVLVPGEKYLFQYYKKRGYHADFSANLVAVRHGMLDGTLDSAIAVAYDALTPEQLYGLRESMLAEVPHIRWYPAQLRFVLQDAANYGEHLASYNGELGIAYAIYGMQGRRLFVKECLGTTLDAQHFLLSRVVEKTAPGGVSIQLPRHAEFLRFEGEVTSYGMAKPLGNSGYIGDMDPYMNLMLD